ncbi:hypothetical protein [Glutamicibacter sp. V16R2B1]|uniref:hypothetical protein n=1 Tax=Glutamicibacter sp. V16R2B1 TaxID=2036207 RepID=UPI0010FE22AE|nr:hypothetical protein [Glutamicibacter sp. V16R2B1]TLK46883.1 hypothetical protein FDN03_16045 [Glutamicibacter sp. V16R2B1]
MPTEPRRRTGITIQAGPVPIGLWPALIAAIRAAGRDLGVQLRVMPVSGPGEPVVDPDTGLIARLRARVAELEESNRVILGRKARLADEMSASEGVSNKLVAEADDARLSAERHAAELLGAVGAWVRTASREQQRAEAAEADVERVRALHRAVGPYCSHCSDPVVRRGRMKPDGPIVSEGRLVPYPCPTVRALDAAGTPEPSGAEDPRRLCIQLHNAHRGRARMETALHDVLTRLEADAATYQRGSGPVEAGHTGGVLMAVTWIREALAQADARPEDISGLPANALEQLKQTPAWNAAGTPELASEPASSLRVRPEGASGVATAGLDREPGTAEHGSWKPQIYPIVGALRAVDWTDFNPTRLDDLADVAAVIAGELFPPEALERAAILDPDMTHPAWAGALMVDDEAELGTPAAEPDTSTEPA